MKIKIKLEENAKHPVKKTSGAACYDCYAYIPKSVIIWPFQTKIIPLGFRTEFEDGYYLEIRGRSGNSLQGVQTFIGTIDSDYRGILSAITHNASIFPKVVKPEFRIAQMIVKKIEESTFEIVTELSETERGSGGFGSTGK